MIRLNFKKITAGFMLTVYMATSAGSSFCVTNAPNVNLRQPVAPAEITLEGETKISNKNPKISLSLRDADVKQILRMFADKAGKNIVFHQSAIVENTNDVPIVNNVNNIDNMNNTNNNYIPTPTMNPVTPINNFSGKNSNDKNKIIAVNPKITLDLVNVPLNEAFKMVLKVSGLTYYLEGNTIVVLSQEEAKTSGIIRKELRTIPVKYIDAVGIARFLNKNVFSKNKTGLSNTKIAVTNTGTNELIILGTENDYLLAKKVVEQFDKKPLEETFVMNHTTPREMAYLLCEVLFKNLKLMQDEEDDDEDDDENGDSSSSKKSSDSNSSSSSSSSNSNDSNSVNGKNIDITEKDKKSDSESKELSDIVLGRGLIACQYNNRIKQTGLQSLHTGGLTVAYYGTKGTVTVMGASPEQMQEVRDFIKEKDTKQLQAFMELSILELTEKGSKEFYNTWNIYSKFFSATFDTTGVSTNTNNPVFIIGDHSPNGMQFQGQQALNYSIRYLVDNKKGRILSNPKIIVTNGEKSVINITKDYVKTIQSQIMENQAGGLMGGVQRTITLGEDMGIKVELSPFISRDGYVTLNIKPEYSTELEKIMGTDQLGNPQIDATLLSRRNLDLRGIRLKDGETLVIGGMIADEEHKEVWKFPFLGDIPGIGALFRSSQTTKEKNELIIMVTPRIILDKDEIVNNKEAGTAL